MRHYHRPHHSQKKSIKIFPKKGKDFIPHEDILWINSKIGGHGGSYNYNSINGLATIYYIGNKNKLQVLWYNIILYFKFLKRRKK